jgi:hypothetical protein
MNKRLKRGLIIGVPVLAVIAAALILFLPNGVLNKSADSPGVTNSDGQTVITLTQYNKVTKGQTYEEIKNIMGTEGELVIDEGQTESPSEYLKTYRWYGKTKNAFAIMTFIDGKMASKTYIGLTD